MDASGSFAPSRVCPISQDERGRTAPARSITAGIGIFVLDMRFAVQRHARVRGSLRNRSVAIFQRP
jgi:hypothetical protein